MRLTRPNVWVGGGAGGGSRTHTPLRAEDFESSASAIPPLRRGCILSLTGLFGQALNFRAVSSIRSRAA